MPYSDYTISEIKDNEKTKDKKIQKLGKKEISIVRSSANEYLTLMR